MLSYSTAECIPSVKIGIHFPAEWITSFFFQYILLILTILKYYNEFVS